jgi:hypothetical protein
MVTTSPGPVPQLVAVMAPPTVQGMVRTTWEAFTDDLDDRDLELLETFRQAALALPSVEERVHETEVQYAVERIFAAGFVRSHKLELAIDLLREVEHPHLRAAFPTTKKVVTHRFGLPSVDAFDDRIRGWLAEAHETVGPGTR